MLNITHWNTFADCLNKKTDILFALDNSDAVTQSDFRQVIRFVRDFVRGLDLHVNRTRVGLVLFSKTVGKNAKNISIFA